MHLFHGWLFYQIFSSLLDTLSHILIKSLASPLRQAHFCLHGKDVVITGKAGWRCWAQEFAKCWRWLRCWHPASVTTCVGSSCQAGELIWSRTAFSLCLEHSFLLHSCFLVSLLPLFPLYPPPYSKHIYS